MGLLDLYYEISRVIYGNPELSMRELDLLNMFSIIFVMGILFLWGGSDRYRKSKVLVYMGLHMIITQNIYHIIVGEQDEQIDKFVILNLIGLGLFIAGYIDRHGADNIMERYIYIIAVGFEILFNILLLTVYDPNYPEVNTHEYIFGISGIVIGLLLLFSYMEGK